MDNKTSGETIIVSRPDDKKIVSILKKTEMPTDSLACSVCGQEITDFGQIRAIFPYHSALICCKKFECLIACRNKLIEE